MLCSARILLAVITLPIATAAWAQQPPSSPPVIPVVDRQDFTTNADQPDIYESRKRPRFVRPQQTVSPTLQPPLPVRRGEIVQGSRASQTLQPAEAAPSVQPAQSSQPSEAEADLLRRQGKYREAEPLLRRVVEDFSRGPNKESREAALAMDRHAWILQAMGRYKDAEPLYIRAIAILEKTSGPEHPDTATPVDTLAMLYLEQTRYAEAEPLARRALAIREKSLGAEHADTARSLDTLGGIYLNQDRFAEAEPLLTRALAIREKVLGPEHPDTAWSIGRMAAMRHRQERIAEAEPFARRALAIREKVLGPDHPHTASSVERIAGLHVHKKQYDQAEALGRRVIAIREKALGPEHPYTIQILDRMAGLYMLLRKFDIAEPMVQRTLEARKRAFGPEHAEVAESLDLLAHLSSLNGTAEQERNYIRQALAIREKSLPPDDPRIADTLSKLAREIDDPAEAEAMQKRALDIQTKAVGAADPKTIDILTNLLTFYHRKERHAEASALAEKLLADVETKEGKDSPALVKVLDTLARLYNPDLNTSGPRRRPADAELLMRRALAIRETLLGPDHAEIIDRLTKLARVTAVLGKVQETEALNKRALAASERTGVVENGNAASLAMRLARFYVEQKRYPEAEQYFKRFVEISEARLREKTRDFSLSSDLTTVRDFYKQQNKVGEAEAMYKRFLAIVEEVIKDNEFEHGYFIRMLAGFYADQKRFAEAEALYLRDLTIQEKALIAGNQQADVRSSPDSLERMYADERRPSDTEALYRRVLATLEQVYGPDGWEVLVTLSKLGAFLSGRGEQRDADHEAVLKRIVAIVEKKDGPESDEMIRRLTQLAQFYMDASRDAEAEPLLKRALAIRDNAGESVPYDNPVRFGTGGEELLQKLADFYVNLGRFAEAEPLLRRGLAVLEARHGPEHRNLLRWIERVGEISGKLGRPAEAEQMFKRAIAIEDKVMLSQGTDFFSKSNSLDKLEALYKTQARDAEREQLLRARFDVEEKALVSGAIQNMSSATNLILLYREQKRDADREALIKREIAAREKVFGPENERTASSLGILASFYSERGRDSEAGAIYERVYKLSLKQKGPEHRDTINALGRMADSYKAQGRREEAERTYKEVLGLYEKNAKPDPLWLGSYRLAFDALERFYVGLSRTDEIEPLYQRATKIIDTKALADAGGNVTETYEKAVQFYREHYRYADAMRVARRWLALKERSEESALQAPLTAVGTLYQQLAQYAEAEPLLKRALAVTEKAYGSEDMKTVDAILNLSRLYRTQGRYDEAEPLVLRALAIEEAADAKRKTRSKNSSRYRMGGGLARSLTSLAVLRQEQNRHSEAEEILKRSIDVDERHWGRHASSSQLHNLGNLYLDTGRYAEAEPLLKRVVQIAEARTGGGEHIAAATPLQSLAELHMLQGRYAEAEPLLKRAQAVSAKVNGPAHPITLSMEASLATINIAQERYGEAEELLKHVLANREKAYGPDHPSTVSAIQQLLNLYLRQDRAADTEKMAQRLQAIMKSVRPGDDDGAYNAFLLGRYEEKRGNLAEAWRLRKIAATILINRARKQNGAGAANYRGEGRSLEIRAKGHGLISLVRTAAELGRLEPARIEALGSETFEIVQWARHSEAASALAQTSARFARGDSKLAKLVRERQDLVAQFKAVDGDLVTSLSSDEEKEGSWKERRARQDQIWDERTRLEKAIQKIDAELKVQFPDYAALANPEPLSVAETQAQLKPGEALYQILFDEEAAYAWVVTKDGMQWRNLPVAAKTVSETISALRCGLDSGAWDNPETTASVGAASDPFGAVKDCRTLLGRSAPGASLPFDVARAHELYKMLFAPFEDVIRDKHLMVVQPGLLASLPLQVLVTEAPDPALKGQDAYAKAAWLALRQPVTVLPSVPSLKALRASNRPAAEKPYAGFGNPLLDGENGTDRSAWNRKECSVETASLDNARMPAPEPSRGGGSAGGVRGAFQSFYRGGLGDVSLIRRQQPLPETADELCTVAKALGGSKNDVFLGEKASESTLKSLSKQGRLSTSRVVHFATHGLIGGETEILTRSRLEPALIMTPPDQASEEDDGLLTASEAAQLALNADLVILSACNTAAGDGKAGGEALSGLARAFLYAGSRALLASHWYVNSVGAVELVTGIFSEAGKAPGIGLAEALRRAMAARIQAGGFRAHPSYWAPFILVGEGGKS